MGKNWWIKLDIGAWQKDVDVLSLEAEGALLKLTFKLEDSPLRGRFEFALDSLSKMLKNTPENTRKIMEELRINNTLNVEFMANGNVLVESRRMLREAEVSRINSVNGKRGGRGKKRIKSEMKANQKRNESESLTSYSLSDNVSDSSDLGKGAGKGEIEKMFEDQEYLAGVFHRYGIQGDDQTRIPEHYQRSRIVKSIQHDTQVQAKADFENYVSSWIHKDSSPGGGITKFPSDQRNPANRKDKPNQILTNGQRELNKAVLRGDIKIES